MADLKQLESAGRFKDAIEVLKSAPTYDATYFYNLGILHGKSGTPGLAVAYLEKANHLKPHDPEIQRNLNIARKGLQEHLNHAGAGIGIDTASTSIEMFTDRI
jgi:hypothetical protein